jgi:hypothetical protein
VGLEKDFLGEVGCQFAVPADAQTPASHRLVVPCEQLARQILLEPGVRFRSDPGDQLLVATVDSGHCPHFCSDVSSQAGHT